MLGKVHAIKLIKDLDQAIWMLRVSVSSMFCGASCGEQLTTGMRREAFERRQDPNVRDNYLY